MKLLIEIFHNLIFHFIPILKGDISCFLFMVSILPYTLTPPSRPYRHGDLDGLSFSTLGWGHTFGVIRASINNSVSIRLFRLQLQWDKHTTNGNVPAMDLS